MTPEFSFYSYSYAWQDLDSSNDSVLCSPNSRLYYFLIQQIMIWQVVEQQFDPPLLSELSASIVAKVLMVIGPLAFVTDADMNVPVGWENIEQKITGRFRSYYALNSVECALVKCIPCPCYWRDCPKMSVRFGLPKRYTLGCLGERFIDCSGCVRSISIEIGSGGSGGRRQVSNNSPSILIAQFVIIV